MARFEYGEGGSFRLTGASGATSGQRDELHGLLNDLLKGKARWRMKEERRFGGKVKFFIDDIEIVCFDVADSGIDAIAGSGMRTHISPFKDLEFVEYSPEGGLRFLESRESGWKVEHCFY